jgi:predicted nucleic acid-binding protein
MSLVASGLYLDTSVVISLIASESCHRDVKKFMEEAPKPHYVSTWTLAEALGVLSEGIKSGKSAPGYQLLRKQMVRVGSYLSQSEEVFNYLTERLSEWIAINGIEVCDDLVNNAELKVGNRSVKTFWVIRNAAELAARFGLSAADAMHLAYVWKLCPGTFLTFDSDFVGITNFIHSFLGIKIHVLECKKK